MKYIISVALKRIKKNLLANILIFLQMIIGIIMLTVFLNVNFVIRSEYKNYLSQNENNRFKIYAKKIDLDNNSSQPIVPEQEKILKAKMGEDYNICVQFDIITFAGKSHIDSNGESIIDRYIVEYSSKTNDILIDSEFLESLKKFTHENTVNYDDICFYYSNGNIVFNDKKVKFKEFDFNSDEYTHYIRIPIEYYYSYNESNSFTECYVEVEFEGYSTDTINHTLHEIEIQLDECNNCYDYILSNEFFEYLYKSSFDSNIAKLFSLVSILLIIIVYIGMLSFFIMLIEKRKFEISVCLALGAKKKQIFSELSIEFLIISLTPTLLGLAVANTIINNGFKFINIYISNYSVIAEILILLSIIIINFSCLNFVLCKIRKLKPQEILYKNI